MKHERADLVSTSEVSDDFKKVLELQNLEHLKRIPKTDLHNHSLFGTRLKTYARWAQREIEPPPVCMDGLEGMSVYIRNGLYPYGLRTKQGVEFAFESAIQQAISDGVTYLEMSIDFTYIDYYPDGAVGMAAFVSAIQKKYETEILLLPEIGMSRERDLDILNRQMLACIETGVFRSLDLYGLELAREADVFINIYRCAKQHGMKLKAHAGEFGTAESVRHTVEILELNEVQHGIAAAASPEVMRWLRDNEVRLNVCPTSNVRLGIVRTLREHPIRILYDHGVSVTINTDDLMIFDQSVSEEYANLFRAGVFTTAELDDIRTSAFL